MAVYFANKKIFARTYMGLKLKKSYADGILEAGFRGVAAPF
jgi:hypothetical protein